MGLKLGKLGKSMGKLSFGSLGATIIVAAVSVIVTELMEVLVKDFVKECSKEDNSE
ncbi:MAG: hypothetical protein HQK91_09205 [Nitrospirae bacterium]|nr:hypothetical protein [Nitrospirota bacterium]